MKYEDRSLIKLHAQKIETEDQFPLYRCSQNDPNWAKLVSFSVIDVTLRVCAQTNELTRVGATEWRKGLHP